MYIRSPKNITASIVTRNGTINWIAVNFSIGIKDIDPKPNSIAGRFKADLAKWNFKEHIVGME